MMVRQRGGFTIIELLIAISITGILLAVLLPAVQRVRSTARKVECTNRLKQLGLALHNIQASRGYYPVKNGNEAYEELFKGLGHALPVSDPVLRTSADFLCPADFPPTDHPTSFSYVFCAGSKFRKGDTYRDGFLAMFKDRQPQEISDGASQTVAMSERLLVPYGAPVPSVINAEPGRYLWWTERYVLRNDGNEAEFIEVCQTARVSQNPGHLWFPAVIGNGYDHRLPPNSPGCWNGPHVGGDRDDPIAPASSFHSGGVNALFVDGHVDFISDYIDADVWRAIGTINGQERIQLTY